MVEKQVDMSANVEETKWKTQTVGSALDLDMEMGGGRL